MKIVNLKEKLYAFVVVLVIIIFGYSLVGIYKDSSAKYIEELENINIIAQAQTLEAKKESDYRLAFYVERRQNIYHLNL